MTRPPTPPAPPEDPKRPGRSRTIFLQPIAQPGLIRDLRVLLAGCQLEKTAWIHHKFSEHAVGLVISGRGTYQVDDGPVQPVEPGCIFSVYPGPTFHYGPFEGTSWAEYHFGLGGLGFARFLEHGWFPRDGLVRQLVNIPPLVEGIRELMRVTRRGMPGDADRSVMMAQRLFVEMYYCQARLHESQTPNRTMAGVLDYCREHLAEEIDFGALAEAQAVSYSSLRQAMKRLTGMGPAHYLAQLRCRTACELLSDTDLSVKEIGARVGIADPYTFSRLFKRHIGFSPQHFRERAVPWAR